MLPTESEPESQPTQGLPELRPAASTDVRDRAAGDTRDLPAVIGAVHRAVLNELAGATAESGYLAIARLSGHLAAMRRAVCTPLRKRPGSPQALISRLCAQGRAAEWSLWLLQGRMAGDALASSVSLDSVHALLGQQLTDYMAGERALLAWIGAELPAADRERLTTGYLHCLAHGPSRPHPRGPRTGSGFRMAFAFHSFWDRVMDGMDGRPRLALLITRLPADLP
jgi:hypothetical protein